MHVPAKLPIFIAVHLIYDANMYNGLNTFLSDLYFYKKWLPKNKIVHSKNKQCRCPLNRYLHCLKNILEIRFMLLYFIH